MYDHPGYLYSFNTQSLLTFEESLKCRGDIPLVAYISFETTAPTDECLDPKNRKMFAVSYVIIFAFHPDLDIDHVIIERSFGHSREKLTSLNYLICEQLDFKGNKTLLQLRDCALVVAAKSSKIAISEMFTTGLKFATHCLLKWLNKKSKSNNLEVSDDVKRKYEIDHPIDWSQDCCCICTFPLKTNQRRTMQARKQYPTLILLFSRNINF